MGFQAQKCCEIRVLHNFYKTNQNALKWRQILEILAFVTRNYSKSTEKSKRCCDFLAYTYLELRVP